MENVKEKKITIRTYGCCPTCGKEYVRPLACSVAVCDCGNPTPILVPVYPVLLLPKRSSLVLKLRKIAKIAGIPFEDFVSRLFQEAVAQKLKEMNTLSKPKLLDALRNVEVYP